MKRWRKQPNGTGLASICQGTRGLELRENGETLAHVAKSREGGWYWYGFGINTHSTPTETKEEAKEEVNAYVKANST